jgi:hypothetical protein
MGKENLIYLTSINNLTEYIGIISRERLLCEICLRGNSGVLGNIIYYVCRLRFQYSYSVCVSD